MSPTPLTPLSIPRIHPEDTIFYKDKDMIEPVVMRVVSLCEIPDCNGVNTCVLLVDENGDEKFCMLEDCVIFTEYENAISNK
jgi:hypothetical protein